MGIGGKKRRWIQRGKKNDKRGAKQPGTEVGSEGIWGGKGKRRNEQFDCGGGGKVQFGQQKKKRGG